VADDRPPVGARDADGERAGTCELRSAVRMPQPWRRRRRQNGEQSPGGKPTHVMTEHPRRKAVVGDDNPGVRRWVVELGVADRGERQVAEGATTVPALEARLVEHPLRPGVRIDAVERLEPRDPGEA